ncbi:hypothetical protein [Amycolatopsis thermoflava]|uniref:hypothetical protein n=1 Tax=Amycolatopsis thermoflava TaxID=84480 RepID=UPI00364BBFB9
MGNRLRRILADPAEIELRYSGDDLRLLRRASESERDRLREVARDGAPESRVPATLALARLGGAREALAATLADDACTGLLADGIGALGENYPEYADLVAPWAARVLGAIGFPLRDSVSPELRGLASACGELRIAEAGPVLLRISRAADEPSYREKWPLDSVLFLAAAAKVWPVAEVSEEITDRFGPNPDDSDSHVVEAIGALAARGEPEVAELPPVPPRTRNVCVFSS